MPFARYRPDPNQADGSFFSLLYRFLFFDWLFADLSEAKGLFESQAARRHNLAMRKYLPTYLCRWVTISTLAFLTGCLCDRVLEAQVAASCFFTGFGITLAILAVIIVVWVFLA